MQRMKRVFGIFEVVFDALYLASAFILGLVLLRTGTGNYSRILAGVMALVLAFGDAFHLLPRILVIITHREEQLRHSLGRGKQITSITMTVFYLFLWEIGKKHYAINTHTYLSLLVYGLATLRVLLCFLPQNCWTKENSPLKWAIIRNIPFFILGEYSNLFSIVSALHS